MALSDEYCEDGNRKPQAETGTRKRKDHPPSDHEDEQIIQEGAATELIAQPEADDHHPPADVDTLEIAQTQRKRQREKQRRGDENRGFQRMARAIVMIDPEVKAEHDERQRRIRRTNNAPEPETLFSRVELIKSAVIALSRVHQENEERKAVIAHLSTELLSRGLSARPGVSAGRATAAAFIPNRAPNIIPPRGMGQEIHSQLGFNLQEQHFDAVFLATVQQAIRNGVPLPELLTSRMGTLHAQGASYLSASLDGGPHPMHRFSVNDGLRLAGASLTGTRSLPPDNLSLRRELGRDGLMANREYSGALLHQQALHGRPESVTSSTTGNNVVRATPYGTSNPIYTLLGSSVAHDATSARPGDIVAILQQSAEQRRREIIRDLRK